MNGAKCVRIFGEEYPVLCDVRVMRTLSAHGDYADLLRFLSGQNKADVRKVFLVHGEYPERVAFRERLLKAGFEDVEIPDLHSMWEI